MSFNTKTIRRNFYLLEEFTDKDGSSDSLPAKSTMFNFEEIVKVFPEVEIHLDKHICKIAWDLDEN